MNLNRKDALVFYDVEDYYLRGDLYSWGNVWVLRVTDRLHTVEEDEILHAVISQNLQWFDIHTSNISTLIMKTPKSYFPDGISIKKYRETLAHAWEEYNARSN